MIPIDIQSVCAKGFNTYTDAVISLPRTGAVLIVGPNGSGKSSLMEAVAWALWGKTLRGAPPYPPDADGSGKKAELTEVYMDLRGCDVLRRAVRGKPKELVFHINGERHEAATVTKAQGDLDENFVSFDSWRRCSVFSGQDLSAFSNATDAERKRLIESILNIDRFEAASKKVREQVKPVDKKVTKFTSELSRLEGLMAGLESASKLKDLEEINVAPLDENKKKTRKRLSETKDALRDLNDNVRELRERKRDAEFAVGKLIEEMDLLGDDLCPTCKQEIPEALVDKLVAEQRRLQAVADEKKRDFDMANREAEQERETYTDMRDMLQDKIERLHGEIAEAQLNNENVLAKASALRELEQARVTLEKRRKEHEAASLELRTLQDASRVLGTKGVRAHILGATLGVVSKIASAWLQEFSDGKLGVKLSAYKENKDGSVADSINVEVSGAGGGYGYKACSGGQRRRIDVAILLGLAQVASSSRGHKGGTLWLDEVFNQLDDQGFDAVGGMVEDLAKDRCVAVISHRDDIQDVIDFARIYHVDNGNVGRVK